MKIGASPHASPSGTAHFGGQVRPWQPILLPTRPPVPTMGLLTPDHPARPCCGGDRAEAHLQQQRFPRVSPALCLVVSAGALLCSRGACIGGSGVIHFGEHASATSSSTSPPSNQGVPVICKCPDFGAICASCILMLDFYQNETLKLTHVYANICMHGLQPLLPAPSINTLSVSYSTASSAFFSQCFSQPGLFSQGGS